MFSQRRCAACYIFKPTKWVKCQQVLNSLFLIFAEMNQLKVSDRCIKYQDEIKVEFRSAGFDRCMFFTYM